MATSEEIRHDGDEWTQSISKQLSQRCLMIIAQHLMSVVDHLSGLLLLFVLHSSLI